MQPYQLYRGHALLGIAEELWAFNVLLKLGYANHQAYKRMKIIITKSLGIESCLGTQNLRLPTASFKSVEYTYRVLQLQKKKKKRKVEP